MCMLLKFMRRPSQPLRLPALGLANVVLMLPALKRLGIALWRESGIHGALSAVILVE